MRLRPFATVEPCLAEHNIRSISPLVVVGGFRVQTAHVLSLDVILSTKWRHDTLFAGGIKIRQGAVARRLGKGVTLDAR